MTVTFHAPKALLQLGIAHPDARIGREDGRNTKVRLQRQAVKDGHLAPRPGVKDQFVVIGLGRALLEAGLRCDRARSCLSAPVSGRSGSSATMPKTNACASRQDGSRQIFEAVHGALADDDRGAAELQQRLGDGSRQRGGGEG